jgi:hypothetical protein
MEQITKALRSAGCTIGTFVDGHPQWTVGPVGPLNRVDWIRVMWTAGHAPFDEIEKATRALRELGYGYQQASTLGTVLRVTVFDPSEATS